MGYRVQEAAPVHLLRSATASTAMAALTSSAIAPLRVRAAAPAAWAGRKVCNCCRVSQIIDGH